MKHRGHLSQKERNARSKAARLIHDKPLVVGSLVEMARMCGKPNCKCTTGDKHVSWYLALRYKGKRKMIHIPRRGEADVFDWVNTYQEIVRQIDVISQSTLEHMALLKKAKE